MAHEVDEERVDTNGEDKDEEGVWGRPLKKRK